MVRLDGLLDPETGTRICSRLEGTAEELRRQDNEKARNGDASADTPGRGVARGLASAPLAATTAPVTGPAGRTTQGPDQGNRPRGQGAAPGVGGSSSDAARW